VVVFIGACFFCVRGQTPSGIESLLAKLGQGPLNRSDLYGIEGQPSDSRTVPALKRAFEARTDKEEKQWISLTLIRLGEKSDEYFQYLAGFARTAVEDKTPIFIKYDPAGRSIRGEFAPEFLDWCHQNGRDPRSVASLQWSEYAEDVHILAQAEDPRSIETFRAGLLSSNALVVGMAVQGLGRLNDSASLSQIAQAAERLPEGKFVVAAELPWFSRGEADQLMQQIEPDRNLRDFHRRMVTNTRKAELELVLRRTGVLPAKQ